MTFSCMNKSTWQWNECNNSLVVWKEWEYRGWTYYKIHQNHSFKAYGVSFPTHCEDEYALVE